MTVASFSPIFTFQFYRKVPSVTTHMPGASGDVRREEHGEEKHDHLHHRHDLCVDVLLPPLD